MSNNNVAYQKVTDALIESLQRGVAPWRKPWTGTVPMNGETHRPYRGINSIVLAASAHKDVRWLTWSGIQRLGGKVRKGEKSRPVVLWRFTEFKDPTTGEITERIPFLKYFSVWNVEQCEGLKLKPLADLIPTANNSPIAAAETIVANMPQRPDIQHGQQTAFYAPALDQVGMPDRERFAQIERYYSTLFHELAHSTGHKSRLNREEVTGGSFFGSEDYSREELVAEFCAAFLCNHAGIASTREQSAAYLAGWLNALKNDQGMAVWAAGRAQKAADYILGVASDDGPSVEVTSLSAREGVLVASSEGGHSLWSSLASHVSCSTTPRS